MVTVAEATSVIFNHLYDPRIETVELENATGRVLAALVGADRDLPPFNRVSMDGIAILHSEWSRGRRTFSIEATQAAGERQKTLTDPARCIEVMTGAVLPAGCDTVIRYEDLEVIDAQAHIKIESVTQGQSIHMQGMDAKKDQLILEPGQALAPSEIALLASVGKASVPVYSFPRVAIISTGDELVDVEKRPAAWQVRRSNSYALQSAVREMGADAACYHLEDKQDSMRKALEGIADSHDVLILSGGVSKGKFDFVPEVLEAIGIKRLFHEVSQRPGKPFWFGRSDAERVAFALPGNPVSTFMCFYRYVKPWILKSLGTPVGEHFAVLDKDVTFQPPLTYFLQVAVRNVAGTLHAHPVPGGGSGDFANLKNVTGFLELPLEKSEFRAGEVFPYIPFRQ
jgi:molybdopterin molybdotransferase